MINGRIEIAKMLPVYRVFVQKVYPLYGLERGGERERDNNINCRKNILYENSNCESLEETIEETLNENGKTVCELHV